MRARLLPAVLPVASVVGVPAHAADPPSVQVAPYSPANYDATAKQL